MMMGPLIEMKFKILDVVRSIRPDLIQEIRERKKEWV